jgi:chemotaxis protein methyltransferase CheR
MGDINEHNLAPEPPDFWSLILKREEFEKIVGLVHGLTGMNLRDGKEELVRGRLMKRLRALRLRSFAEYIRYVHKDATGRELVQMIDVLTTNKTHFFREMEHFDFLRQHILPKIATRRLRIWCAGCSSGEEPYTVGMVLNEDLHDLDRWDIGILATDISTRVLETARLGVYSEVAVQGLPKVLLHKYFRPHAGPAKIFEVVPSVKDLVSVAKLNLMDDWPMTGMFDVVFCRNVMIYFKKELQQTLVKRFWDHIAPGGYLFVGHSESLSAFNHRYCYVQPAVYRKVEG